MNKIVIIEDSSFLKLRLEKLFIKNNLVDLEALNGELINDAYLNYLEKSTELYVIDLDNYSKDSINVISQIHNLKESQHTPIIALSKSGDLGTLKSAVKAGCSDFLLKPFDDNSLVYKVNKLIGLKHNHDHSPNKYIPVDVKSDQDSKLEWNRELEINIGSIDEEHRQLFSKYDELYELMKSGKGHEYYNELISFLNDYVHTHFAHEETLHKTSKYPLKEEHNQIHEEFKMSVQKISEASLDHQVSNTELVRISLFIKNWLIHHILIEDAKFGDYLKSNDNQLKWHSK